MSDYDTDFYAWTQRQAAVIRAGAWAKVDREHLAEEIEDMGKSERRAVVSHLRVILTHRLKWDYQSERRSHSWLSSILHAQAEIELHLHDSPSLYHELPSFIARAYGYARRVAARETGLPIGTFPPSCPWSSEHVLGEDFIPNTPKEDA
jgi:hypothetical protein